MKPKPPRKTKVSEEQRERIETLLDEVLDTVKGGSTLAMAAAAAVSGPGIGATGVAAAGGAAAAAAATASPSVRAKSSSPKRTAPTRRTSLPAVDPLAHMQAGTGFGGPGGCCGSFAEQDLDAEAEE